MLDAFLTDSDLRELWFSGADRVALQKMLDMRAASRLPASRPAAAAEPVQDGKLIRLTVSPDEMMAWISLSPALQGATQTALEALLEDALQREGVTYGVRRKQLQRLLRTPVYDTLLLVAEGDPPQEEPDGAVRFSFTPDFSLPPLWKGSYGVDAERPDFVHMVQAGELLCTRSESTVDRSGRSVRNRRIQPGHRIIDKVEPGENVRVSPDGCSLYAQAEGEVVLHDDVLSVLPVLRLPSVTLSTGDVHYAGSIYVDGSVEAGCTLEAGGNVAIGGNVEDCQLMVGGHLAVGRGVKGGKNGFLHIGGSLRAPFLENARATIEGDLFTDVLFSDEICCEGGVYALGQRGRIVGGSCEARQIEAQELGNLTGVQTSLKIVSLQPLLDLLAARRQDVSVWDARSVNIRQILYATNNKAKKIVLERMMSEIQQKRGQALATADALQERIDRTRSRYSFDIRVRGTLHAKVSCVLLDKAWNNAPPYTHCRIFVQEQEIRVVPLPAEGLPSRDKSREAGK